MSYQDLKRLKNERKALAFLRAQQALSRENAIVDAYKSGDYLTRQIADKYGVSSRQVQRICKKWGVLRTQREGAEIAGPLGPRHRLRGKSKDHVIGAGSLRDIIVQTLKLQGRKFDKCEWCGKPFGNNKWQLHHTKYEGATVDDLMIVCQPCNLIPANRFLD